MLEVYERAYRLYVVTYKIAKYFRVEKSCYQLVLHLNFIVTVELLYDLAETDLV